MAYHLNGTCPLSGFDIPLSLPEPVWMALPWLWLMWGHHAVLFMQEESFLALGFVLFWYLGSYSVVIQAYSWIYAKGSLLITLGSLLALCSESLPHSVWGT